MNIDHIIRKLQAASPETLARVAEILAKPPRKSKRWTREEHQQYGELLRKVKNRRQELTSTGIDYYTADEDSARWAAGHPLNTRQRTWKTIQRDVGNKWKVNYR